MPRRRCTRRSASLRRSADEALFAARAVDGEEPSLSLWRHRLQALIPSATIHVRSVAVQRVFDLRWVTQRSARRSVSGRTCERNEPDRLLDARDRRYPSSYSYVLQASGTETYSPYSMT